MRVVTPGQMNRIDALCIDKIGIPGIVLMENAALKVVEEISRRIGSVRGKKIVLFAGKGNNGGDALAVSRHLFNRGAQTDIFLLARKEELKGDAKVNLDILTSMGIEVAELVQESQICKAEKLVKEAHLIVDGIFGTGLKGAVSGVALNAIKTMNGSGKEIIAIDIPSGINGETGKVPGVCVKAHATVTFGLPKLGLILHPGCEYVGELVVSDIGIPEKVVDSMDININTLERDYIRKLIPERVQNSNKGSYGKLFVISGSKGMTGAGCLSAKAALRAGTGLVYLGVPDSLIPIYNTALAEAVTVPLCDRGLGYICEEAEGIIEQWFRKVSAVAVGPGLSVNGDITGIVEFIIKRSKVPLILDADALNAVSLNLEILKELKADAVITPHPGEMSRLAGITIEDVQNNRIEVAREFSRKWGIITVLKGAKTVVACPDGRVYINSTGNSGMSTAGTGDVLTGIIAGFAAQGVGVEAAALAGVYIHGRAGDAVAAKKGEHGLIAGDIVDEMPYVIRGLVTGEE